MKLEKLNKNNKGFTLLETIVATGVIVGGIVPLLTLMNNSLVLSFSSQDRLIAANLAAEGIEVIRNIRDNNRLQSLLWNNGLSDGNYNVSYNSLSVIPYVDIPLKINSSSGIYDYSIGSDQTIFKRIISITNLSAYEMRVISTVNWQRRNRPYSITVEDHLFNRK